MSFHSRKMAALLIFLAARQVFAEAPVQVESVSTRPIVRQVDVTGTVTSPRTAVLSTAVAGIVAELAVDEGHRVAQGDVLLKLDAELAQLALERTAAQVRQRETELADARRRLDEAEKVGTARGIPASEIASLRAEVSADEAALAATVAASSEQRAVVDRHTLKAPFSGVISARNTELGEWVNPGDGLLQLVATDNLRFDFRVGQELFAGLAPDTPIEISLDAVPGESFAGRIDTIVPVKNPATRTFLVRASATSASTVKSAAATPGMSVRGRLSIDTSRSGVVVTRDAILRYPDGRVTVWVVNMQSELPVVREQRVTTGAEFDGVVQVASGLSAGDVVVTHGNETLQDGQTVTVLEN